MKKILFTYIPVPHAGYLQFFEKHNDVDALYIMGEDLIGEFTHLHKDIHGLPIERIKQAIESWGIFKSVNVMDYKALKQIQKNKVAIIMPNEDITHELADKYFQNNPVEFDGSVFLRWDKHNTVAEKPATPDVTLTKEQFDRDMMNLAYDQRKKSSDWWRQVGSVLVKDGKVVLTSVNQHVPSPHIAYAEGNPRNNFSKGVNLELINTIHGEASLIAEAAKKGIALEGASIYASTFPCPPCAKLIAYSGIKKCYFHSGYGVTDGERIMKQLGVELIFVDMGDQLQDSLEYTSYNKNKA